MHAYQREKMKEEKRKQLEARRERLRQLLLEEQALLAKELEELRLSMDAREGRIRERHGNLKSAREEQRKLVTSLALQEPMGRECPQPLSDTHAGLPWARWSDETTVNSRASRERYSVPRCSSHVLCTSHLMSLHPSPLSLCQSCGPTGLRTGVFDLPSGCGEWGAPVCVFKPAVYFEADCHIWDPSVASDLGIRPSLLWESFVRAIWFHSGVS